MVRDMSLVIMLDDESKHYEQHGQRKQDDVQRQFDNGFGELCPQLPGLGRPAFRIIPRFIFW